MIVIGLTAVLGTFLLPELMAAVKSSSLVTPALAAIAVYVCWGKSMTHRMTVLTLLFARFGCLPACSALWRVWKGSNEPPISPPNRSLDTSYDHDNSLFDNVVQRLHSSRAWVC